MYQRFRKPLCRVSFQSHYIRRHLRSFSTSVGRCRCIVDIGSGESSPHRDLFDCDLYIGLDRFERADAVGDANALPLPSAQADLVLCTEVLEHLPEPQRALGEMNRVLVSGGVLMLTTPLIWGEHDHVDYQRWTEAGLRRIVGSAGFEIQEFKRRGGIFTALGCLVTRVPLQVFGAWDVQPNWLLRILYVCCWLVTLPLPWLLVLLDPLDRKQAFTAGFSLLCRKAAQEKDAP